MFTPIKVGKIQHGVREVNREDRRFAIQSEANDFAMTFVEAVGRMQDFKDVLTEPGNEWTHLGDTGDVTGAGSLAPYVNVHRYFFKEHDVVVRFTNQDLHAVDLTVCEIISNRTGPLTDSATSVAIQVFKDMEQGLNQEMSAGATTVSTASNEAAYNFAGAGYSSKMGLGPFKTKYFKERWNLKYQNTIRLNPGDTAVYGVSVKNIALDLQKHVDQTGGLIDQMIAGVTKCVLAGVKGVIGHGNGTDQQDFIGYMPAHVSYESWKHSKFWPFDYQKADRHDFINHDNLTNVTLQAPTDFTHKT